MATANDKFQPNAKVFAKLKGFPPWPAKIVERVAVGRDEKYRIIFYGTHDEATVKWDQIFPYNEQTKGRYGKPQRKPKFNDALEQIEIDSEIGKKEGDSETINPNESTESNQAVKVEESEDGGELTIDERPPSIMPPVLKKETEIKPEEISSADVPLSTPKSKRPRTLNKRDSLNTTNATTLSASAAVTPGPTTPSTPDGTEIVSRSGRKIKPKRFADDEITTLGGKGKTGEESAAPATKKKRTSVSAKTAPQITKGSGDDSTGLPPSLDNVDEPQTRTKITSKAKPKETQSRLSPDIVDADCGPPTLKVVSKRTPASTNKQIPSLIPTELLLPNGAQAQSMEEEISDQENGVMSPNQDLQPPELDETDVDKENSLYKTRIVSDPKPRISNAVKAFIPEKKIRIATKSGAKFELSYSVKNPDARSDADHKTWHAIATENVKKIIEDLKQEDVESQELLSNSINALPPTEDRIINRKLNAQLNYLRLEGEVIEIIGEIVGCLGAHSADCVRAVDLLERLEEHKLNTLTLKKHPEVVYTIQKLRHYVGNVDDWGFTEEQKEEFETFAHEIRRRATNVYHNLCQLFGLESPEDFPDVFEEEVEQFKAQVEELPLQKILGLTEEENGELCELVVDLNGDYNDSEEQNQMDTAE